MKRLLAIMLSITLIAGDAFISYGQSVATVPLTEQEREYIDSKGPVRIVVDPDWYPYEKIDATGVHVGIAADLIDLISQRTGLDFELVPTADWDESLRTAKSGRTDVISCLNKSDERSRWLLFTEPYYTDPNVLITREEHDYISNLSRLSDETVVLPEGTSVEERLRKEYPNLKIIRVKSEEEALTYVDRKKADMTLRSLTMAAFIIKNKGYFNLKIAGEVPDYANSFRMGITKEDTVLQGILDKGIASITEQEVQTAINNHISLKIMKGFDYRLFSMVLVIFLLILLIGLIFLKRIQGLNRKLQQSEAEYRVLAVELEKKNALLSKAASVDVLTGLQNRYSFNVRASEEVEKASRYGSELSLLLIDMDHFKRINDNYGHDAGDDVIRKVSVSLHQVIRKGDLIARWGGEEFVVLMPGIGLNEAVLVGEKLRHTAESLVHLGKEIVTISAGVSAWTEFDSMESWFKRTDKALYHAKQEGRNRVCASDGAEGSVQEQLLWNPAWNSGHPVIDQQHQDLLERSNALIAIILKGDMHVSINEELGTLLQQIRSHFDDEEEILRERGYEALCSHVESHQSLLIKAESLAERSAEGRLLPGDVVRFIVGDVVSKHLIQEDMLFFGLFLPSSSD